VLQSEVIRFATRRGLSGQSLQKGKKGIKRGYQHFTGREKKSGFKHSRDDEMVNSLKRGLSEKSREKLTSM